MAKMFEITGELDTSMKSASELESEMSDVEDEIRKMLDNPASTVIDVEVIEIIETVYRSTGRVTVKYVAYLDPNEVDSVWNWFFTLFSIYTYII